MASPLFLLAPPRSFTSIICAMIGQHPQIYGMPELNIFNFDKIIHLWQAVSDEIGFDSNRRHGLLRAVAEIYMGEQTDESIEFAEHWCALREHAPSGEVFSELCEKVDPLIIVDKSPTYTMSMERLKRIISFCPDARFIHLTRHPIKQCESAMQLNRGIFPVFVNSVEYTKDDVIIEPQIAWHDINALIMNFLHDYVPPQNYIRVRGENVMEHTQEELKKICQWLKIRDDDNAILSMMRPEESPFACFGPITALFGNDPNFLKNPIFKQHTPKLPSLYKTVSWRKDGHGLYDSVIKLANEFEYY